MLDKILFLYHGGSKSIPVTRSTGAAVSGGISPSIQIIIILIFIGLIGWFFWHIKKKKK